jgi:hypothetical protein
MRRIRVVVSAACGLVLVPGAALGADAGAGDEVATLEAQLATEHAALATSDCAAACRALGSIRRAADKICALEPGARCDAARSKADDATRRVREACPDCSLALAPLDEDTRERAASPAPPAAGTAAEESAPRGGCRSCASAGSGGAAADWGWLAGALLVVATLGRSRQVSAGRRSTPRPGSRRRR